MRKIWLICAALVAVPLIAWAAAGDHSFAFQDDLDNAATQTIVGPPLGKALLMYDSNLPNGSRLAFVQIDGSITETGGVMSSYIPSWATLDSKPAWLNSFTGSYTQLQDVPGAFNPASHVHPWAEVTGSADGVRASIELSTSGSGAATYNPATGVFNIPTYTPPALSISNSPGRSLVTATNATGYQVSATRVSNLCYEGTFQTTTTIGGPASVTVFLETANTNSTTPSDWTTIARQTNGNTVTLAVALQQVDTEPWAMCRYVAAGKYVRIRSGSVTGTATATINTEQQEVLL